MIVRDRHDHDFLRGVLRRERLDRVAHRRWRTDHETAAPAQRFDAFGVSREEFQRGLDRWNRDQRPLKNTT